MLSTAFLTHPEVYDQVDLQECVRVDLGTGVTQKLSTDFIRVVPQTSRNRLAGVEPTRGFESHALRHRSYQPRLVASFLYPEMEIAFHCACRCEL